jgi:hypothetical protein
MHQVELSNKENTKRYKRNDFEKIIAMNASLI